MADRTRGALPPANLDGLIETLLDRLDDFDGRLRGLEANTGRALPGDWRFVGRDGKVLLRRVSTGDECELCASVPVGSCPVTFRWATSVAGGQVRVTVEVEDPAGTLEPLAAQWIEPGGPERPCGRPPTPAPDLAGLVLGGALPWSPTLAASAATPGTTCALVVFAFRGGLGTQALLSVYSDTSGGLGESGAGFAGSGWAQNGEAVVEFACLEG